MDEEAKMSENEEIRGFLNDVNQILEVCETGFVGCMSNIQLLWYKRYLVYTQVKNALKEGNYLAARSIIEGFTDSILSNKAMQEAIRLDTEGVECEEARRKREDTMIRLDINLN